MPLDVVLALDLGTTNAKAGAYDRTGLPIAAAQRTVHLSHPAPMHAEQDAQALLTALGEAARQVADDARRAGARIVGVACSGAMHAVLAVDAEQRPLTPVLTWADNRAFAQAEALAVADPGLPGRTGTPVHPSAPLAKLAWFREHRPAVAAQAARWVSVKELLLQRLTGQSVVDFSVASATGMFNLAEQGWDRGALALAGLAADHLSTPVPTETVLHAQAAEAQRLGLPAGVAVVVGAADGCLANLGAGAVDPGVAALTIGTSGALRVLTTRPAPDPEGRLFCYVLSRDRWVVGAPTNAGGATLQWAREQLLPDLGEGDDAWARIGELAAAVPAGADGLLVLPSLLGDRAPTWNPLARGVVFGLTARHGREHLLRAFLEGVALQLALVQRDLLAAGHPVTAVRASGGFTDSAVWLGIVASALGRRMDVPGPTDASSLGAALLGWQALGEGDALELARAAAVTVREVAPDPAATAALRRLLPLAQGLAEHLRPDFAALAALSATEA